MKNYEKLGIVGEGAYGIVYKAMKKDVNQMVAIKMFKETEDDEVVRQTTYREIKMLKTLKQENIVQLLDAFKK